MTADQRRLNSITRNLQARRRNRKVSLKNNFKFFDDPHNSISKKIIILFAYLSCFALCVWQSVICIHNYLRYQIGTKRSSIEEKITYLPSISICNNYHRFGKIIENYKDQNNNSYINQTDIEKTWSKFGIDKNKIKINRTCNKFQTDNLESDVNVTTFNSILGQCVDITLSCPLFQRKVGMIIKILEHPNIQNMTGYDEAKYPYFNIYPHNWKELDILKIYRNLDGTWKAALVVILEKSITKNIISYAHPCIPIDQHIKCRHKCVFELFEKNATCKIPTVDAANLPFCTSWGEVYQSFQLYNNWLIFENTFQNCSCIRPCKKTEFRIAYIQKEITQKNILKLEIIMDDSSDDIVSEYYLYDLSALIGDLSGIIGFFLGVSLFSVMKILERIGRTLIVWIHKRKISVF